MMKDIKICHAYVIYGIAIAAKQCVLLGIASLTCSMDTVTAGQTQVYTACLLALHFATVDLCSLANSSQNMGSHYLGYELKLYTTI